MAWSYLSKRTRKSYFDTERFIPVKIPPYSPYIRLLNKYIALFPSKPKELKV